VNSPSAPSDQQQALAPKGLFDKLVDILAGVLPKPAAALLQGVLKNFKPRTVQLVVAAFIAVLFMPVLSVWAMQAMKTLLPVAAAERLQSMVNTTIHEGYGIDAVARRLERSATEEAIRRVNSNNSSLDYIQLVEFYLERQDVEKVVPVRLKINQSATITIHQVVPIGLVGQGCTVPDTLPTQDILLVHLDKMQVLKLGKMLHPGSAGKLELSSAWWASNETVAKTEAGDGVFEAVRFTKTAEYEKSMSDCVRLRVIADIAVHKLDLPPMKP
jgi:hypothetical protein